MRRDETPDLDLNLLWLRPGSVGGTESYVIGLLDAIAERGVSLRLVATRSLVAAHPHLAAHHRIEEVDPPGRGRLGRAGRVWCERRRFGASAQRAIHHLGGTIAAEASVEQVLTIYDVQVLDHPEFFTPLKRRYLRRALPNAVSRANTICVMSEFVAESLGRHLGVERDRCRIVPPAVAAPSSAVPGTDDGDPYLLYPAVTWPHKRHEFLVDVMEALGDTRTRLVMTGGPGPGDARLREAVERSSVAHRVEHRGLVSHDELRSLYARAAALVFPSVYEGFGQPLAEAMAAGCPVIAGAHGAIPEVLGDAGLLVADEPTEWAAAVEHAVGPQREALVRAGRDRARAFSPAAAAAAQLAVYAELG